MATKLEYYSAMGEDTACGLTKSREQWTAFLRTAGRMSKYSYEDQLLIFAQRPEATACAEYDLWNNTMRRYVKRGSSGIALIDNSGDYPRLHYVFDVADTGARKNSREVNLWHMEDEYVRPVQEALSAVFDVSSAVPLDVQVENIAGWLAIDYWQDHEDELADIVADSYLEEYDEDNRRMSFLNAATVSIKYEILSRCVGNPDDYFEPDEFSPIFDYNTRKSINALGTAVSEVSGQVFREIEVTIRNYERSRRMERSRDYGTDLQTERGLSDSQHRTERDQQRAAGQIRQDAPDISERAPSDPVHRPVADRAAVPASEGDRRDGAPESRTADDRAAGEEPGTGQNDTANGLDSAHERPESTGGGDRTDGAGLQLTEEAPDQKRGGAEPETEQKIYAEETLPSESANGLQETSSEPVYEQMSLFFPSETEQIEAIDNAAESEMPSASLFSQDDIDHVLRLSGRNVHSRQFVAAGYMQGNSMEELISLLRYEYRGGHGLLTDNGRLSAWFDDGGIWLAHGDHARDAAPRMFIPWQDAAVRIGELLDAGKFATDVELAETAGQYRAALTQSIWYLRHDFSELTDGVPLLSSLEAYRGGGYPEETERLASALADPDILAAVTRDMEIFSQIYEQNRDILRFHYHHVPELVEWLHTLGKPWKKYTSDMAKVPEAGHFITEDEIDEALTRGSHMAGGKNRIYSFFSESHSAKEQADFLRDEYGTGGFSGVFSNNSYSFADSDGKGLRLSKEGAATVTLSWNQVAKRVNTLVKEDRYFTKEEKERIEQSRAQIVSAEPVPETSASESEPAPAAASPDIEEAFEYYLPIVRDAVLQDTAYRNACRNSDRENAMTEGEAAVNRAVITLYDTQLYGLYYDNADFHNRLTQAVLDETYSQLSAESLEAAEPEQAESDDGEPEQEADDFSDIDPIWLRERLAEHGIVNGELVDPEKLEQSLFIQMVEADIERIAAEEAAEAPAVEAVEEAVLDEAETTSAEVATQDESETPDTEGSAKEATSSTLAPEDRFHVIDVDWYPGRPAYSIWDDQTGGYYVDRDGLTVDFVSRWNAEEYCKELIENAREEAARSSLDRAKDLIDQYCMDEFSVPADFDDMTKIGIGYTTISDEEIPIEASVNLVDFKIERYLNDRLFDTRQYESLEALISEELEHLDFNELMDATDDEIAEALADESGVLEATVSETPAQETAPDEVHEENATVSEEETSEAAILEGSASETAAPVAAVPSEPEFPYHAGDTIYLEDGRPFVINSIGMFDVHLLDPSLRFPVLRAESRENFLRLMERYPQTLAGQAEQYDSDRMAFRDRVMDGLTTEQKLIVDAMEAAGWPFRPTESNPIYFGDADDYPVTFSSWEDAYAYIDSAQLNDAPGLREMVQEILHPSMEPVVTEEPVAFYPGEQNGLPFDVEIRRMHFDEPERETPEPGISAQNYRITDDHLGEGGPKQKYAMNVAAIRTLQTLEAENRNAAPEEQAVLARYVGWGSLADAFDPNKTAWSQEYHELKGLLTEEEYVAARASTLNAHYTSPTVIRAIYDAVEQMGFTTGNILEPSMGVGNFFGLLPDSMQGSRLYGVELDSITGRIAQKLYPNADIKVAGFETTDRRDFYDLAIGNVPFGDYKVNDRPYNKLGFSIHNYFFAKALDQVRPGGVVAFVTSRYTMDAKSPDVRKYLAQRAELLGAIRLPNNAFRANAGTDVVSDIIFLQKRDTPIDIEPDWVHLGLTPDGLAVNSYFIDHPEMVMGELTSESTQYGREECTVAPIPGADLAEQLREAVSHIHGSYQAITMTLDEGMTQAEGSEIIPADPSVKNFSFTAVDGEVYFREDSVMRHVNMSDMAKQRALGMISLRETVNDLIEYQLQDYPDEMITAKQKELEAAYDKFTADYGLLNSRANAKVFGDDSSYYLLCSLEDVDEDGKLIGKADMFTKRTIRPDRSVTSVDTPVEALAVSIGEQGGVDLPFMSELLGTPGEYGHIIEELSGVIFRDPFEASNEDVTKGWHTADDYLSGDVRAKLQAARLAAKTEPEYAVNEAALEKAQPKDLDASEIDVRLGATWIDKKYIQQFMEQTFETPFYMRRSIEVKFSPLTAEWQITGKTVPNRHDVAAYVTYGTDRANAYRILEETLNLKDIRIYDTVEDADGKQKRILNKKETTLAQQKQQAIKDAFQDWVWKDPRRREDLCQKYNELFNSTRPREYDGSHIRFVGMNPEINLREHQKNAIAHVLYGGNTLLAHEVGAGKTFEMAAAAMESKRLGLCQKSLFVVPNHLTTQWANEFLRLYPSAKLLVATRKDFETARRKKFCARIATGDYDAVIIGHSQFEKIPVSAERQERELRAQIDDIEDAIASLKYQRNENFTIKQMEKTRRSLQARLEKLTGSDRKDDVVTFEQLGVDRLFVDESHSFKNLFLYTKMRNVAGLSTSEAQKSSDMYMKCRYMDELTGGRGVVFATGTPVSNSMTELYTVMRYLQYGTLQKKGLTHFDSWASTFGETQTAIELAPEGTGYRARTRFAKFFNLPELMNMFKEIADIKTADQLDLPVPDAKFETVVVQPSEYQKEMVQDLSERAAKVHVGVVDSSEDNMLCITSDGRKIGLDQRLMNPLLPDDPNSKLNACVDNVFRIWQDGTPDKLTQLLFCDMSTPKNDGSFNVYDDIRSKLEARGIPHEEIAFIHTADTEVKKKELFAKVRNGQVRVLLGSTQKMGAGTNVQDRLIAVHHLDVGWRPADQTQRNGRIIRQGNQNKEVQIYNYVTEGTFDAYLFQTLENKQRFISQIMTSKSPVRSCDDVDEQALSYAEIKALCAGDSRIKEKMDLDIDVAKLKVLKADFRSKQYRLEDQLLKYFPREIEQQHSNIDGFQKDIEMFAAHQHPKDGFAGMTVSGKTYTEKADAGEAILAVCKTANAVEGYPLGSYRGFQMELSFDSFSKEFNIALKGSMTHRVPIGSDARGNLIRLDNALNNIPAKMEQAQEKLATLEQQQEAAREEVGKPFPQEKELADKSARLAELDAALNMEERPSADRDNMEAEQNPEDRNDGYSNAGERHSVLADLKQKAGQMPPLGRNSDWRREEAL